MSNSDNIDNQEAVKLEADEFCARFKARMLAVAGPTFDDGGSIARGKMLTIDELAAEAAAISMVAIEEADRDEFAVALVLQGYEPQRAHQMAYETIADNDGALQMLARQRRRVAWAAALPKEGEEKLLKALRERYARGKEIGANTMPLLVETELGAAIHALSSLPVSGEVDCAAVIRRAEAAEADWQAASGEVEELRKIAEAARRLITRTKDTDAIQAVGYRVALDPFLKAMEAALTPQQATDSGVDLDPPMKRI